MKTIYISICENDECSDCQTVQLSHLKEITHNGQNTGFKCYECTFDGLECCSLALTSGDNNCCICIKICKNGDCSPEASIKIKISENGESSDNKLHLYFYEKDPRPLLFCFDGKAYIPKGKDEYFSEWEKAPGINTCVCKDENGLKELLLDALTNVVGFLNEVDLSKHPPETGGIACSNTGTSVKGGNTCAPADQGNSSCTYDVHQYGGRQVMVKVTCDAVPRNGGETGSSGGCNYKKLTHEPAGMCAEDESDAGTGAAEGFRLGDVVYNNGKTHGSINYYKENGPISNGGNLSDHWRQPLVKVEAYFYNQDKNYKDPLLVVLEFKNGAGAGSANCKDGAATVCEYYKLKDSASGKMEWESDTSAKDQMSSNPSNYLDKLRYGLKQVVQIKLEQNSVITYPINVKPGKPNGAGNNGFRPIPEADGKRVIVVECADGTCAQLTNKGYKCYKHKIKEALNDIHDQVAGVVFTIPGQDGKDIVIPLYNDTAKPPNCNNGQSIEKLMYNKCMGDVYVFFYDGTSSGVEPASIDTVPLMLWYDKNYYKPCSRDDYFTRWEKVDGIDSKKPPCEGGEFNGLVNKLNEVNRALNRIDLNHENVKQAGTRDTGYGLPENGTGSSGIRHDPNKFPTKRVELIKQNGPSQPPPQPSEPAYVRVVHRTVNGFQIGAITYNKQDFADNGVNINSTKVEVKKNGDKHTSLVKTHKWNTVVAYYSTSDTTYQLPQLIVILKTDGPVSEGGTVTGSANTPYGYYILSSKTASAAGAGGGVSKDFEYVWREVTNGSQVTLNDATDFRLLNSVVLLIDKQSKNGAPDNNKYVEDKIKPAIDSAIKNQPFISSPGISDDINRLRLKEITVKDETTESTCLKDAKFKVFAHNIGALVTLEGQLKTELSEVTLIAGLRFLIPTRDRKEGYKELRLYYLGKRVIYHQNGQNKICVFFYDQDPRPLLLCYNREAYIPIDKITYFRRWYRVETIKNSDCKKSCNELMEALVAVSDFLNPVNIKEVPTKEEETTYEVHEFNGQKIRIQVEKKPATETFCYHKYTYTHNGTGSGGTGFRLGTIYYGCNCIRLVNESDGRNNGKCITSALDKSHPYTAASQVVVFYYKYDTKHEFPMVVAMSTTDKDGTTKCKLYYVLKDKGGKIYKKKTEVLDLSNNETLGPELDKALFSNSNHLQILIDRRPIERLYCPKEENNNPPVDCKKDNNICDKLDTADKKLYEAQCDIINCLKEKSKKNNPECVLLSAGKSVCYKAKLYNEKGAPLSNGSDPTTTNAGTTTVKVTQVDCPQLTNHGYKCYEHDLLGVKDKEQIGGLKFFLWDNGGGGSVSNTSTCGTTTNTATTSASCPAAGSADTKCRELCLYKDTSPASRAGTSDGCTTAVSSSESGTPSCTTAPGESKLQLVTTSYTTCKGNVYVYFYGDDPRPLMLCYAGGAYGPRCLDEYDCRWVCVVA